jgi:CheY-like chemotaxis protein
MKCPKCHATVKAEPDPAGYFSCSGCGIRLKMPTRPPKQETPSDESGATKPEPPAAAAPEGPPTVRTKAAPPPAPPPPPPPPAAQVTIRPQPAPDPATSAQLDAILKELREVRRLQELVLSRLDSGAAASPPPPLAPPSSPPAEEEEEHIETVDADDLAPPPPAGPNVLLVDDDAATRASAKKALAAAGIDVRIVEDGSGVLGELAARQPSAIVLEAELGGPVPARDLIDSVKATMEWVNIPIVLYTRRQVADEHEARTRYGADAYVVKGPGAEVMLAGRVNEVIHR